MSRIRTALPIAAAAVAAATIAATAHAFEGTLNLRTVSLPREQAVKLAGAHPSANAAEVFAVPMDKVLGLKGTPGVKLDESTVYVSGSKLRAETPLPDDPAGYVIVDVDENVTRIVLPKEKRYIEWTSADAQALSAEMDRMRDEMKARVAKLPPEQRKQMEKMMKELPGMEEAGAAAKVDLRPLGRSRAINGFQATGYEVQWHDETTRGWVTQDVPDLTRMYKTSQENLRKMVPAGANDPRAVLGEQGLPVLVQTLGPEQYRVEELVAVEKKPVPAGIFEVPADFKKTNARDEMRKGAQPAPAPAPAPVQ